MQLSAEQTAVLTQNVRSWIEANQLSHVDAATRLRISKHHTRSLRLGKIGSRMTKGVAQKLAQGMGHTFLDLTSKVITEWKKVRVARVGKKARGRVRPESPEVRVSRDMPAENVDSAVLIDVNGIIHTRRPATSWPYDREGTTAVQVGRVLVLVKLVSDRLGG